MSWQPLAPLPWEEPLAFAARFSGRDLSFLYSALHERFSGDYSYLLVDPVEVVSGDGWDALPTLPAEDDGLPLWVGYLGYGLRECAARGTPSTIALPDFALIRYAHLFRFHHPSQTLEAFSHDGTACDIPAAAKPASGSTAVRRLGSNLSRRAYESIVSDSIARIHKGDFYQANITRKFFGDFATTPDSWRIFSALTSASPAPYSAYIRHGEAAILSSSPECFLSVDAAGTITTRPIKGSARRSADAVEDEKIQQQLQTSAKNHAENLMIVDLMRNDLARVSDTGSVHVTEQSALYSYATIHHLISTIQSQKRADISVYDVVRACFPAGSMTGAPKIAAMEWCAAQEKIERGVYSGAIGWFGGGQRCDLSVVIRTLIIEGSRFEFQVGGGIVADSTPAEEWRETITKARGILRALGLTEDDLAAI
ncbi:MAG: anthranilate synthase component I family protein [Pseudomonadota bacterium]